MANFLIETTAQAAFEWVFHNLFGIGRKRRKIEHIQTEDRLGKRALRRKRGKK